MHRLDGKIAIITGAARGMGRSEAMLFAAEGARVVLTDVLETEVEDLAADLGERATYAKLDVTDAVGWDTVLDHTRATFGEPDVLVNNAGILYAALVDDTSPVDLQHVLAVYLVGPFLGTKIVGCSMAGAGRGSILNVSSRSRCRMKNAVLTIEVRRSHMFFDRARLYRTLRGLSNK